MQCIIISSIKISNAKQRKILISKKGIEQWSDMEKEKWVTFMYTGKKGSNTTKITD